MERDSLRGAEEKSYDPDESLGNKGRELSSRSVRIPVWELFLPTQRRHICIAHVYLHMYYPGLARVCVPKVCARSVSRFRHCFLETESEEDGFSVGTRLLFSSSTRERTGSDSDARRARREREWFKWKTFFFRNLLSPNFLSFSRLHIKPNSLNERDGDGNDEEDIETRDVSTITESRSQELPIEQCSWQSAQTVRKIDRQCPIKRLEYRRNVKRTAAKSAQKSCRSPSLPDLERQLSFVETGGNTKEGEESEGGEENGGRKFEA